MASIDYVVFDGRRNVIDQRRREVMIEAILEAATTGDVWKAVAKQMPGREKDQIRRRARKTLANLIAANKHKIPKRDVQAQIPTRTLPTSITKRILDKKLER